MAFPCCCLGCVRHTAHMLHGTCAAILVQEIPDCNVSWLELKPWQVGDVHGDLLEVAVFIQVN